jgi:hypothetical protein
MSGLAFSSRVAAGLRQGIRLRVQAGSVLPLLCTLVMILPSAVSARDDHTIRLDGWTVTMAYEGQAIQARLTAFDTGTASGDAPPQSLTLYVVRGCESTGVLRLNWTGDAYVSVKTEGAARCNFSAGTRFRVV